MSIDISIKYAKLPNDIVYFYQHWIPKYPRALVVFVHGLGDHIGRYNDLVARFTKKGTAFAMFDQRGHGRSGGRRGHVEKLADLVEDLTSFINFSRMCLPSGTPLFLIGSSLGALIGINYILTNAAPVEGMVTLSAAIRPTIKIPEWKKKVLRRLAGPLPRLAINNGIKFSDLTRNETETRALAADGLFHTRMTLNTALEIEKNLELVMAMPHRIHAPMLMLAGSEDKICDPDGTREFSIRLSSTDKRYHIYDGMYHDLLHDEGRDAVFDEIEKWLDQRIRHAACERKQFSLNRRESLWENVSQPPA